MAALICGRRILSARSGLFRTPKRRESGYYVLLPEIGEDLPEKNPLLKEETMLPEFNSLTIEKCIAATAVQTLEFEHGLKAIETEIAEKSNLNPFQDVFQSLERLEVPLQTTWGISKVLYLGNQSLMPTKCYLNIHRRTWTATSKKYTSKPIYEMCKKALDENKNYTEEEKRILEKYVLEGKRNGLDLSEKELFYFRVILNKLTNSREDFRQKLEIATNLFKHKITDPRKVQDFPDEFLKSTAVDPKQYKVGPWIITLKPHIVQTYLEYCPDSIQRWNIWQANNLRCSNYGEQDLQNSSLVNGITNDKHTLAKSLGFQNYVDMCMATKMAETLENINNFLETLRKAAFPRQVEEINALTEFAKERGFDGKLQQWDVPYWARKQKLFLYKYDEEILKEYFPLSKVLEGIFDLLHSVFNVRVVERNDEKIDVWHRDVRFFDIYDLDVSSSEPAGSFYFDPYARDDSKISSNRHNGWVLLIRNRSIANDNKPLSSIIFNFQPPEDNGKPSLLTFKGVQSLFENFGHILQQLLTRVNFSEVAGLSNVEWDATATSKHFMAHFVYEPNVLKSISSHYKTGEPLDDETIENLRNSCNHMAGFNLCKELYLCRFDLDLHSLQKPWERIMKKAWKEHFVFPEDKKDSHVCSWDTVFVDNLGASYYSDLWSRMLAADVYSAFQESPTSDENHQQKIGKRFKDTVLVSGGSVAAGEIFRRFRGRDPSLKAFIKNLNLK